MPRRTNSTDAGDASSRETRIAGSLEIVVGGFLRWNCATSFANTEAGSAVLPHGWSRTSIPDS
jgi:hypothetical protein